MYENVVVIDSNFILLPFQFKINYLNEIYLNLEGKTYFIIFKQILNELEAKKNRESKITKFQMEFKSGLLYLESNKDKFNILFDENVKEYDETTDEFLIKKCNSLKKRSTHVFLATNDSNLRKEAKKFGISTIFLRQKKYLSFD
ncbi:MAG: PIN domain-containing protein [Candidatus Hermodarchaeota archaeon]